MYRVLLVEDNEANRDMLSRRLIRHGWEVLVAADGIEALRLAPSACPDVVLMDLRLPLLDGWEAIRQLKSIAATRSLPVIALTAHAMAGERERALAAGSDDFETKPLMFARLLQKMEALAGARAAVPGLSCARRSRNPTDAQQCGWTAYAGR